jgi:hypothetical protein
MSLRTKLLATVAVLGLLAGALGAVVHSSFTATAKNEGNSFETGSISLTDGDSAHVLFDLDGLEPASGVQSRCVKVSYGSTGALRSTVRLFGTSSGALSEYLNVKVTRGSFAGGAPGANGCDGFSADANGVLFDDTLDVYPRSWDDGIVDPDTQWQAGDSAVYRFDVAVADTDDAQGKSASHAFSFEARTS